jgi:hypothetical protein
MTWEIVAWDAPPAKAGTNRRQNTKRCRIFQNADSQHFKVKHWEYLVAIRSKRRALLAWASIAWEQPAAERSKRNWVTQQWKWDQTASNWTKTIASIIGHLWCLMGQVIMLLAADIIDYDPSARLPFTEQIQSEQ